MDYSKGKELLKSKWLSQEGPKDDIVISSRVRLARNLADVTYPSVFSEAEALQVSSIVEEAINSSSDNALGLQMLQMKELNSSERGILVEKHLISPQQSNNLSTGAFVYNQDESLGIMVNEEDHMRIQSILPGLELTKAWELANDLDDFLESKIDYAYSEEKGYLTSCPTNVGTGLRASVMMHLPGLVMTKQISRILSALSQIGLTVRGLYGEGTEVNGDIFQISNQITLGQSEEEVINNINSVINEIINKEKVARERIFNENKYSLEDRVFRSLGAMKYARVISSVEALNYISYMRLGVSLGLIDGLSLTVLKEMMVLTRPALLQQVWGEDYKSDAVDILRASLCRGILKDVR